MWLAWLALTVWLEHSNYECLYFLPPSQCLTLRFYCILSWNCQRRAKYNNESLVCFSDDRWINWYNESLCVCEWQSTVTTLDCPLQAWRKYDLDCSGYISAQELKVSKPPQIKWSLFTQQNQSHSQEEWPWEGERLRPWAAPLCPVSPCCPSVPSETPSRPNELFLTLWHTAQLQPEASQ